MSYWQPFSIKAGQTLKIGGVKGPGVRAYIGVLGGIDVPSYLGSKSTFTLGKFGGHGGRVLMTGDVLHIGKDVEGSATSRLPSELETQSDPYLGSRRSLWSARRAGFLCAGIHRHVLLVRLGIHYNSNPTGIRLIGPKPVWARTDGGEAGLHPSNIHDNAYAIGTIDFTGDMPVILGPDGPSLGGFVCPATIVQAELWKMGQLRPGDKVRFKRLSPSDAAARLAKQTAEIASLKSVAAPTFPNGKWGVDGCIVGGREASGDKPRVVYRRAGDAYMLVEYGPIVLDFELRFRAHALMTALERRKLAGILDLTPGIRSLQVHYDSTVLPLEDLLAELSRIEDTLGDLSEIEVPSRVVHLPISWNDPAVQKTIDKYMQGVRPDAPWCPSNIEFIRRINGLDSIEDVKRIVFDATYVVLGLGDVYLGAPVATPFDPRHRLVTTKYNPARTWTPDNVVGIGGAYMCIYGMEGPGGYQLFGRTCQVWNTYRTTEVFEAGSPWLLRFFDQIRFHEISGEELLKFRDGFLEGRATVKIEPATFSLKAYQAFAAENADTIAAFKSRQQAAFEAERARWEQSDQEGAANASDGAENQDADSVLPPGATAVESPVPGSVWKILVEPGRLVAEGETLIIVESMKMEMAVPAPVSGIVHEVRCVEGRPVALGQALVILKEPHAEATA